MLTQISTNRFMPWRWFSAIAAALLLTSFAVPAEAQNCLPGKGALYYIVRDAKGKVIDPDLFTITGGVIDTIEIALNEAQGKAEPIKVIRFGEYSVHGCGLNSRPIEFTLTRKGKTMTLVFTNAQGYIRVTVDSLPFQEGKFEINTRGERSQSGVIAAKGWKRL